MAFEVDREKFTVEDAERGLSLEHTGGGSDGRGGRVLIGPDFRCTFDVYSHERPATPAELSVRPDLSTTIELEISNISDRIPRMSWEETYDILSEAVAAEKYTKYDDLVNRAVVIRLFKGL
jgi:hypothetical protein